MRTTRASTSGLDQLAEAMRDFLLRRTAEIAGLALLGLAIACALALVTWSVQDPSLNHATSGPVRNLVGRPGAIVNTASIMGLSGGLYPNVAYQTSKGGVVNMTRALALEWAPQIRVNAVAPTFVNTKLIAGLMGNPQTVAAIEAATPNGRIAEPEEIASAILFLAGPAAAMITGVILPVDGGYLAR